MLYLNVGKYPMRYVIKGKFKVIKKSTMKCWWVKTFLPNKVLLVDVLINELKVSLSCYRVVGSIAFGNQGWSW